MTCCISRCIQRCCASIQRRCCGKKPQIHPEPKGDRKKDKKISEIACESIGLFNDTVYFNKHEFYYPARTENFSFLLSKIEEVQESLQNLSDSNLMFFIVDRALNLVAVSKRACELTQRSYDNLLGKKITVLIGDVSKDFESDAFVPRITTLIMKKTKEISENGALYKLTFGPQSNYSIAVFHPDIHQDKLKGEQSRLQELFAPQIKQQEVAEMDDFYYSTTELSYPGRNFQSFLESVTKEKVQNNYVLFLCSKSFELLVINKGFVRQLGCGKTSVLMQCLDSFLSPQSFRALQDQSKKFHTIAEKDPGYVDLELTFITRNRGKLTCTGSITQTGDYYFFYSNVVTVLRERLDIQIEGGASPTLTQRSNYGSPEPTDRKHREPEDADSPVTALSPIIATPVNTTPDTRRKPLLTAPPQPLPTEQKSGVKPPQQPLPTG